MAVNNPCVNQHKSHMTHTFTCLPYGQSMSAQSKFIGSFNFCIATLLVGFSYEHLQLLASFPGLPVQNKTRVSLVHFKTQRDVMLITCGRQGGCGRYRPRKCNVPFINYTHIQFLRPGDITAYIGLFHLISVHPLRMTRILDPFRTAWEQSNPPWTLFNVAIYPLGQ